MDEIRFDNKVVIITGSGSGLGKTYALEFARRGAKVIVNDLGSTKEGFGASHNSSDEVVYQIKKNGGIAVANYESVMTLKSGENIVKCALDNFGKVDILINNAGIIRDKSFSKMTDEEWDIIYNVHLKGAFCVTKPTLEIMKKNNYGRIIFTTSGSGLYGNFGQTNYSSAKMGLIGLMNVLKIECAKNDIKVNSIAPIAKSRLTEELLPPNIKDKLKPEFVMPLVLYLSSEEIKETGMIFNCGGGWFSRSAIMCSKGVIIGDGNRNITVEEIRENWDKITSLDELKVLSNLAESLAFMKPIIS